MAVSDTLQGPGYWQASDGKWYPPQPPAPHVVYQQAPKKGHGCLYGMLGAAIVLVVIIVGLVVTASSVSKSVANPGPGLGSSSHPAAADVALTACNLDSSSNVVTASITITNHSSQPSNYIVQVNFTSGGTIVARGTSGGTIVAQGTALENNVGAGQKAQVDATGVYGGQVSGALTCHVVSVNRFAAS